MRAEIISAFFLFFCLLVFLFVFYMSQGLSQDFSHSKHLLNFWGMKTWTDLDPFSRTDFPWLIVTLNKSLVFVCLAFVVSIIRLRILKILISRSICVKQYQRLWSYIEGRSSPPQKMLNWMINEVKSNRNLSFLPTNS